jgi:hypothetical protein
MKIIRPSVLLALAVFVITPTLHAACGATTFTPYRWATNGYEYPANPPTQNALYITDPANEQYALFSMEWGGSLVALRYKANGGVLGPNGTSDPAATDLIWGHDQGGMAQYASWVENASYNPTQGGDIGLAGDHGRGAPIFGAACKDTVLIVHSTTAEFWMNDPPWGMNINYARAATITGGAPRNDMWFTPYAVTFTASFVPNPGRTPQNAGLTPAYYLKLDHYVHATDVREEFAAQIATFALYSPGNFGNARYFPNCTSTPYCTSPTKIMLGHYPNTAATGGVAISMNGAAYMPGSIGQTQQTYDSFWNNVSGSLGSGTTGWALAPGTGRRFVVYVQAGDWATATGFNPQ